MHPATRRIIFIILLSFAILPPAHIQSQYIGKLSTTGLHHWLTASTMKFVDNWLEDGIVADQMMMLEWPNTIEFSTLRARKHYASYLSGAALEIYLLKKIFPQYETLVIIQIFNILNQFLISLLLMAIVWLGLARYPKLRNWFALIAFLSYQMLPQAAYLHSMVFFADIAVLLPMISVLFIELLLRLEVNLQSRPNLFLKLQQKSDWLKCLQSILLTWAVMCDWLGLFLLLIILFFRLLVPVHGRRLNLKDCFILMALPLSVVGLYLWQLYNTQELFYLWDRYLVRSSQGMRKLIFFKYLIPRFFLEQLGAFTTGLLFLASFCFILQLIYLFIIRQTTAFLVVLSILLFTCYSHLIVLPNHGIVHAHFSITKFLMLSVLLFCYWLSFAITNLLKLGQLKQIIFGLVILFGFSFAWQKFLFFIPISSDLTFNYDQRVEFQNIAKWLRNNARFEDVYLGKRLGIPANPPFALALSRKPVHQFSSVLELKEFMQALPRRTHFYAILSRRELRLCQIKITNSKAQIYEKNDYWSVIPFNFDKDTAIVDCLIC